MSRKYTKSRGTRRSSILKRRSSSAERIIFWGKRLGVVFGVIAFIGWLGAWFFLSDTSTRLANWSHNKIITTSSSAGFKVKDILVEGRNYTDSDALMAILNIQKNDPLFQFDLNEKQKRIEQLSWVKTVRVERRLPDTIYIALEERVPMALWQRKKRLTLIDDLGEVVTDHKLNRFKDFIIVVGSDAPKQAPQILRLLESEPDIEDRVEAVTYVSSRRWNLALKSGVTVKLPEGEIPLALRRLAVKHGSENLMDKDIQVIDLRESDRIIVQTKPGAVQEYEDNYSNVNLSSGGQI